MKTLLVNWVYYRPVGHVIEALRFAREFAAADPDVEISLLLNAEAPSELAACVPEVAKVYEVDLSRASSPAGFPAALPRDWDFVFTDPRIASGERLPPELQRFHDVFRQWVHARGVNDGWNPATMPARKIVPLRLQLPAGARQAATSRLPGDVRRMSVLPGAASPSKTPSLRFWTALFEAFFERNPNGEVVLLGSFDRARSSTAGISKREVAKLTKRFPRIHDAFDIGLIPQLALAERCGVHVSPHSGMSFAVQAVGIPWVALGGGEWHEFLLNGVPLITIFPECPLYPCFREMYPDCRKRIRRGALTPCLDDEALIARIPAIVAATEELLDGTLSYQTAAQRHEAALRQRLGPESWTIVDWPDVVAPDYVF